MQLSYPDILLAKENYIEKINTDSLDKNSNLVRRSLVSKEETFDNVGDISINALFKTGNEKDFYEWSTNLLGLYTIEHLNFIVKEDDNYNKNCRLKSITEVQNYEYNVNAIPIFIKLYLLHKSVFPYTKENEQYEGIIYIEHEPLLCNYWHFQVKINDEENNKIKNKNSSTWKTQAAKYFCNTRLKKYCKTSPIPEPAPVIDKELYII